MKTLILALGIFAASTMGVLAAEPAMMGDTDAGKVLVSAQGMTLYTFDKDEGGKSACDAKCLEMWPAFYADSSAETAGDFTMVKGTDGKDMWAYKGKPLYLYREDAKPGDAKGDGKGGVWHVVK